MAMTYLPWLWKKRLKERGIALRVLKRADRPTGMATMDIVDGDKKHLHFEGNAMEEIELSGEDLEFVKSFDIVYAERWSRIDRYIKELKQPGQIGCMIFPNGWSRRAMT